MQPQQHDDDTFTSPKEQPGGAPYVTPAEPAQKPPVVTMTPDVPETGPPVAEVSPVAEQAPSESDQQPAVANQPGDEPVHWQAYEYIHHEKGVMWFVIFGVVVLALMALAIFVLDALTFAILLPVMAVALIVYTQRPPRMIDYTLSRQGLHVNDHLYSFSEFKGFGVIHDGHEYSVMLIPTKRLRAGVFVYFPESAGEAIVDMLGARIPMLELHLDLVDKVVRKLRI